MKTMYISSNRPDVNGNTIIQGHIIRVDDKYGNPPDKFKDGSIHCVDVVDGIFGSDVFSDFEPLTQYNKIEILGHCEDLRSEYEQGLVSGNIGAVIKDKKTKPFITEKERALMITDIKHNIRNKPDLLVEQMKRHVPDLIRFLIHEAGTEHTLSSYNLLTKIFEIDFRYHEIRDVYETVFAEKIKAEKEYLKKMMDNARIQFERENQMKDAYQTPDDETFESEDEPVKKYPRLGNLLYPPEK